MDREPITFVPFTMQNGVKSVSVPMGDAILCLPIAKEADFQIFIPEGFVADLIEPLTDVKIVRSIKRLSLLIDPNREVFNPNSPYFIDKWGSKAFIEKYGPVNATLCWAMSFEMKLENPASRLRRPRPCIPGKVALFPNGAAFKRSLPESKTKEIMDYLLNEGLEATVCPNFNTPAELADFVASCEYAVGVYTGPIHLAAAMGVKTVAIPVGDSALAYRPLQENAYILAPPCDLCWSPGRRSCERYCHAEDPMCARAIRPELVLKAMRALDNGPGGIEILPNPDSVK